MWEKTPHPKTRGTDHVYAFLALLLGSCPLLISLPSLMYFIYTPKILLSFLLHTLLVQNQEFS